MAENNETNDDAALDAALEAQAVPNVVNQAAPEQPTEPETPLGVEQPAAKTLAELNATQTAPVGTVSGVEAYQERVKDADDRSIRRQAFQAELAETDDRVRLAEIELGLADTAASTSTQALHIARAQVHATLATVQS